ncbi:hypothetical protein BpHYR1_009617 [Brachionus plicatilis]|uniref:Uncharacterized protein n=1 Tax=Brachionus plicatilis TaxID=10195 RepID=A0A3M7QG41_BRAPC|nr:hypothetical protein BpHYR1_009617 [Brachionus plicatilis]
MLRICQTTTVLKAQKLGFGDSKIEFSSKTKAISHDAPKLSTWTFSAVYCGSTFFLMLKDDFKNKNTIFAIKNDSKTTDFYFFQFSIIFFDNFWPKSNPPEETDFDFN